jgi:hypothetical protein
LNDSCSNGFIIRSVNCLHDGRAVRTSGTLKSEAIMQRPLTGNIPSSFSFLFIFHPVLPRPLPLFLYQSWLDAWYVYLSDVPHVGLVYLKGIWGDHFVFWNFFDRLFTRPSFERIFSVYPHKSPPH